MALHIPLERRLCLRRRPYAQCNSNGVMTQSFEGKLCSAKNNVTLNVLLSKHMVKNELLEIDIGKFAQDLQPAYLNEMRGNLWRAFMSIDCTDIQQVTGFMKQYKIILGPITKASEGYQLTIRLKPLITYQNLIKKMAEDLEKTKTLSQDDIDTVNEILDQRTSVRYTQDEYQIEKQKKGKKLEKVKMLQRTIATKVGIASIFESFMANAMWYVTAERGESIFHAMEKCIICNQIFLPNRNNQVLCSKKSCLQVYTNRLKRLGRKGVKLSKNSWS